MAPTSPLSCLVYLLSSLICLSSASAIPPLSFPNRKPAPTILGPQPPHFVVYSDESQFGIPSASDLEGFNTLILSFLLASGAADQASAWTQLSSSQRASLKADYTANNITLLVSAFGSTESPTTDGKDPTAMAESMAGWVKAWGMDGIDVDYEDFQAVSQGTAVQWLKTFTTVLRNKLPAGQFAITHAPVAPWFAAGQPYAQLNASVGHLIDWYNVQFYSQGTAYTTCQTLIWASGGDFPGTSVMEIVGSGVPQEKVVVGKPGNAADVGTPSGGGGGGGGGTGVAGGGTQVAGGGTQEAGGGTQEANGGGKRSRRGQDPHINGFLETPTLAQCLVQAKSKGWNAGVMAWEFPEADKEWIQSVRSLAWPVPKSKN